MVSAGDTDISLHIRPGPISNFGSFGGGGILGKSKLKTSKCQDLHKFEFLEGGVGRGSGGGREGVIGQIILWCPFWGWRPRLRNPRSAAVVEHPLWRNLIWIKLDKCICTGLLSHVSRSKTVPHFQPNI